MGFIAGTKVFTDSGVKNIEDISGHDKVLVRNFLGEAEFTQPFALKKKKYEGNVIEIGGQTWSIIVTPDHKISYNRSLKLGTGKFVHEAAEKFSVDPNNRVSRGFRYKPTEEYKRETVGYSPPHKNRKMMNIDNEDWYKLVAMCLMKGKVRRIGKKEKLILYVNDKKHKKTKLVTDIFDKYGMPYSTEPGYAINLTLRSTLGSRIIRRLGSRFRSEMTIPKDMIFKSSPKMIRLFFESLLEISGYKKGPKWVLSSSNKKFIDDLILMGTLGGYGFCVYLTLK